MQGFTIKNGWDFYSGGFLMSKNGVSRIIARIIMNSPNT